MMDIDTPVLVYNDKLGGKPVRGKLIRISEHGYYELSLEVNQKMYMAMLPIGGTVLLAAEPIPETESISYQRY